MHTILAIDDEPASLRTIRRTLGDDFRVLTAACAEDGLEQLDRESAAAVIVDQRMPGMSGTEMLARCGARHPDVVRILLTGYTDLATLIEAINAGHVFSYLSKPWEPHELRLAVQRAVDRHDLEVDRRRLLRELQSSCARLEDETETKTRLLTLAAHELGTPLHLIASALSWLGPVGDDPGGAQAAAVARRGVEWIARVLSQLEQTGRLTGQGFSIEPRRIAAGDLVASVVARHRSWAAERNLRIDCEIPADLPAVEGDRVWLARALANLCSNAIRFTPDGKRVEVAVRAEDGWLVVEVRDQGIGIDADCLTHLFEPFSHATGDVDQHGSGGPEFGARGLGLGLAIAQRAAGAHGGRIDVESVPGEGSRFTLRLPLCDSFESERPESQELKNESKGYPRPV